MKASKVNLIGRRQVINRRSLYEMLHQKRTAALRSTNFEVDIPIVGVTLFPNYGHHFDLGC